jgi:phosphoribosyl 1,2-cyclic phosphate phosphodiesterase
MPRRPSPQSSLTLLGTGTSTGVPILTCACGVCRSRHPRNRRLRASAWFQVRGKSLLVDTSTDLRQQALERRIQRLDAILYTHPHADHTHGIDEVRAYNFSQKSSIPAYGNAWTCTELREKFPYIFKPGPVEGGGIPQVDLRQFDAQQERLDAAGVEVIPISLKHGSKECVGYRIDSVAYVTDCSYIPEPSIDRLNGLSVLVLDCLRLASHGTHFNLDQALETVARLKPKKTFLTHLGHDFDYPKWTQPKKLPPGVSLAYDGLAIRF